MTIVTYPFCISCGNDLTLPNFNDDQFCDSCGFEYVFSNLPAFVPPTALDATGGSGGVTFTFAVNPEADSTDIATKIDSGAPVLQEGVTSPVVIVAAEGETVAAVVRSVLNGVPGPWSNSAEGVATA